MANETETNGRSWIAISLLISCLAIIFVIVIFWLADWGSDNKKDLLNIMLPIVSTWVGTILAFYFGKDNYESASKNYSKLIEKLSPDVLDDALVTQVMTDSGSMLTLDLEEDIVHQEYDVKKLVDFLTLVKKTRLPITSHGTIKYVIHKSLLTDELALGDTGTITFDAFVEKYKAMIEKFGKVQQTDKIEAAQKLVKDEKQSDIFVYNKEGKVAGWLTETQIARYLTC